MKTSRFHRVIYIFLLFLTAFKTWAGTQTVTWLDIKVKTEKINAVLTWSTSQEIDNETFLIERSDNGLTFYTIGTVPGALNSTNARYYSFIDIHTSIGTTYYRVKQIDQDKNFSYSEAVTFNTDKTTQLNVSPYPNNGEFDINITSTSPILQISITNYLSKEVYQYSISNNSNPFNTVHVRLNVAPGLYMVYLNSGTDYRIANLRIE